jgi:hypothetical protein
LFKTFQFLPDGSELVMLHGSDRPDDPLAGLLAAILAPAPALPRTPANIRPHQG